MITALRLYELQGPACGVLDLPNRLPWRQDRHAGLDSPALLRRARQVVLREAKSPDELRTWPDGDTLIRIWPDLYLTRRVRQAWQCRHPELAAQAPASRSPFFA